MICTNCRTKLVDGSKYCPYCGTEFDEEKIIVPSAPKYPYEANRYNKFSILSLIFGIVSICFTWIPFVGLIFLPLSILGIVFGAIGRKGYKNIYIEKRTKVGFTLSLIATILAMVSIDVVLFIFKFIIL